MDHRSKRLKTNRLSLHADLLEKRSHASGVDFQHIMQADFVLFLRGSLGALRHAGEQWWPDTLLYCEEYRGPFEIFARARSAKYFIRIAGLVDITKKDELAALLQALQEQKIHTPRWQFRGVNSAGGPSIAAWNHEFPPALQWRMMPFRWASPEAHAMDIKKLKAFSVVAEFGSFSRAAAVLGVAQPMLSRQVRSLEAELGTELLYRNGRGIVLTEAGGLLNEYAKGILTTVSRAKSELGALKSSPRGNVVIGMPPSIGTVLTVPLIQRFRAEYPSIQMRVIEGFSGYLLEWLVTGKIDVAVLYNAPRTKSLLSEPLLQDELFLLGAVNDPSALPPGPIQATRLSELPLILPSRPHGLRLLIDQVLGEAGITPNCELEVDALPATIKLAEKRVGYTIHSYSLAHDLVEEGRVKCWPIIEPRLTRELILSTSSQRPTTTATRALTSIVRNQVRELVQQGLWRNSQHQAAKPKPRRLRVNAALDQE